MWLTVAEHDGKFQVSMQQIWFVKDWCAGVLFCRPWFRWECACGNWEAGAPYLLHSMNLPADVCGFVSKAFQPAERNGAMVSMLHRSLDA